MSLETHPSVYVGGCLCPRPQAVCTRAGEPSLGARWAAWQGELFGKTGEETQSKVLFENNLFEGNLIQTTENSITTMKTGLR